MQQNLEAVYSRRFDQETAYRNLVWTILSAWLQRYFSPDATVLDLGCGYGQFINHCKAARKYGMDLNPRTRQMLAKEVTLLEQDCSKPWPLDDGSLDVVFTSNFLEHLPNKAAVEETLGHVKRCLKPGGILIAMGPNMRYLPGEYWDFWDHHTAITDRSLVEVLEVLGFEPREVHPKFLPYTMAGKRQSPLLFIKLYLALPLAWRVLGKQFLIIARKPAAAFAG